MRKTIEQERAFYCLKCVDRLRLAKDGKWFELKNPETQYELKSDSFDKFHKYRFYSGIKWHMFEDFVSFFMDGSKNKRLTEILKTIATNEKEGKKKLTEFFYEGKNLNNPQISEIYSNFPFDFAKYDYTSDYSSHAKKLPQMIVSNGLIPTLAFYISKGKDRGQIYADICEILEVINFKPYLDWKNDNEDNFLLEFLLETDSQTLLLTTIEVLAIANWLKRIVEVEIKED
jgi:CRISPR-associated protein Cmr5